MENTQRKKIIKFVSLFVFVVGSVVLIIVASAQKAPGINETEIEIIVAPTKADVSWDGIKTGQGNKIVTLGEHILSASREGYEPSSVSYNVLKDTNIQEVTLWLTPLTDDAWEEARNDYNYSRIEGVSSQVSAEENEKFTEKNPIISTLPYRGVLFNIDYGPDDSGGVVLIITLFDKSEDTKSLAINMLGAWGYDVNDYVVEYRYED